MAVKDIDRGWRRIVEEMRQLSRSYTKVGLPENGNVAAPTNLGDALERGRAPVVEMSELVIIGAVHEYGSRRVPMRSFLRSATDENRVRIEQLKGTMVDKIYTDSASVRQALSVVGEFLTTKVKAKIVAIKTPPLSLATIRRKGSTNPLVDTGQLTQSIQHVEEIN